MKRWNIEVWNEDEGAESAKPFVGFAAETLGGVVDLFTAWLRQHAKDGTTTVRIFQRGVMPGE